jgi:cytochrome c1
VHTATRSSSSDTNVVDVCDQVTLGDVQAVVPLSVSAIISSSSAAGPGAVMRSSYASCKDCHPTRHWLTWCRKPAVLACQCGCSRKAIGQPILAFLIIFCHVLCLESCMQ